MLPKQGGKEATGVWFSPQMSSVRGSLGTRTLVRIPFFSPGYLCHCTEIECVPTPHQAQSLHSFYSPIVASFNDESKQTS